MAVKRSCGHDELAVELDLGAGEHLLYRIETGLQDVSYDVKGDGPSFIDRASCPPPCRRKWPADDTEVPAAKDVQQAIGVQFISDGTLTYRVAKRDGAGAEVEVLKDCTLTNDGGPGAYFDSLRVFLV